MMKVLDLFSGIGGFSLGLERAGMTTVAFCEQNKFCHSILKKHWPDVPIYDDVQTLSATRLANDGIAVDVICGGFPCQDISIAGKGAGLAGQRSGLWWHFRRLIEEIRPSWVIIENVSALRHNGLGDVLRSLFEVGYDAEWHCIPASAVGAPHRRDRIWIVAYPQSAGLQAWRGDRLGTDDNPCRDSRQSASASGQADVAYSEHEGIQQRRRFEFVGEELQLVGRIQRDGISTERQEESATLADPNSSMASDGGQRAVTARESIGRRNDGRRSDSDVGQVALRFAGQIEGYVADASSPRLSWRKWLRHDVGENLRGSSSAFGSVAERGSSVRRQSHPWDIEPNVGRVADGVPARVDRLKALGNAVVPQIPELIGRAILEQSAHD